MRRTKNCRCEAPVRPRVRSFPRGHGVPKTSAEAQRSGFGGKRRSSVASELWPFWGRSEGYGACDDEKQEKVLPLFRRPDGHTCPQCGQGTRLRCPARKLGFRRWGKHSAWLSAPHFPAPGGGFAGRSPHPLASPQSPLCSERHAGVGISRAALLLLSSKRNPLRWASV